MKTAFKRTLLSTLVVPFALVAASASAVEITDWGYEVNSTFSDWTASSGAGGVTPSDGDRKLSWGGYTAPYIGVESSVSITDVSAASGLMTNGDFVDGGVFTHTNNVISAQDAALLSFNLNSELILTPASPAGGSLPPTSRTFASFFSETPNDGNCVAASASPGTLCDDIFTVGNIEMLGGTPTATGFEFTSPSFTIDDYTYTVFLELAGLVALGDDACGEAGTANGCVGLLTEENKVNNFATRFRIASSPASVPEPGTLALLGLSLAGLGLSSRKKAPKA